MLRVLFPKYGATGLGNRVGVEILYPWVPLLARPAVLFVRQAR